MCPHSKLLILSSYSYIPQKHPFRKKTTHGLSGYYYTIITILDEPVIDICSSSRVLVHKYGHIVYWPNQETYSSCVCHFHGATSVTIRTFSPLYKRQSSTCSSTMYIDSDNIPCKTYNRDWQNANEITLVTPRNDRLWVEIYGLNYCLFYLVYYWCPQVF